MLLGRLHCQRWERSRGPAGGSCRCALACSRLCPQLPHLGGRSRRHCPSPARRQRRPWSLTAGRSCSSWAGGALVRVVAVAALAWTAHAAMRPGPGAHEAVTAAMPVPTPRPLLAAPGTVHLPALAAQAWRLAAAAAPPGLELLPAPAAAPGAAAAGLVAAPLQAARHAAAKAAQATAAGPPGCAGGAAGGPAGTGAGLGRRARRAAAPPEPPQVAATAAAQPQEIAPLRWACQPSRRPCGAAGRPGRGRPQRRAQPRRRLAEGREADSLAAAGTRAAGLARARAAVSGRNGAGRGGRGRRRAGES